MRITQAPVVTWIKRSALVALLAAIVAAIVWSLLPRPVPVEVMTVRRGRLTVTVDDEGRTRVRDRYVVAAPLAGTLARIELHPGDEVAAGTVVARIAPQPAPLLDPRTRSELEGRVAVARARRRQADTGVERALVNHRYATGELERVRRLVSSGALAGVERDRQQLAADLATRELESARFAAAIAADELATASALVARLARPSSQGEEVEVRAPVAGRVLRVLAGSEAAVVPGAPLLELGDPANLEIVVDVLTADAAEIRAGAQVELTGWGGAPLAGVVRLVEPSAVTKVSALGVEEQRVAVIVDLVDPPATRRGLGDGWRVEARITTWVGADVVRVPLGALFRDGTLWAVYVVEDGRARLRRIGLGRRSATEGEVTDGLRPGERVIFHPGERISDGGRVEVR